MPHASDPRILVVAANLRDLGGLTTADGRAVRTGRLFRSGHLYDLEISGRATIDALGCLLYTSPSPRDYAASRMPSSA